MILGVPTQNLHEVEYVARSSISCLALACCSERQLDVK